MVRIRLIVALIGGVLLGLVDLVLQKTLPYPWANLANSSAVWAVLAFALGYWVRRPWWGSALAGAVLLVLAVPSYYVAATLIQGDDLGNVWAPTSLLWMAFGLVAGLLFGAAGHLARLAGRWRVAGIAMPGAVLFAEAAVGPIGSPATSVIQAVLGVLIIVLLGRGWRERLLALAVSVPLAAVGYVAFLVGGFRSS